MSTLNFWCYRDLAVVACDTAMSGRDGEPTGECSKLFHIPHANVVVAGRGQMLHVAAVAMGLQLTPGDFDDFVQVWPDLLQRVDERARENGSPYVGGAFLVLLGWSRSRSHFRAIVSQRSSVDAHFESAEIPSCLSPYEATWKDFPEPKILNAPSIVKLVRFQIDHARADGHGASFGGSLVIAELTKDSATLRLSAIGARESGAG